MPELQVDRKKVIRVVNAYRMHMQRHAWYRSRWDKFDAEIQGPPIAMYTGEQWLERKQQLKRLKQQRKVAYNKMIMHAIAMQRLEIKYPRLVRR